MKSTITLAEYLEFLALSFIGGHALAAGVMHARSVAEFYKARQAAHAAMADRPNSPST